MAELSLSLSNLTILVLFDSETNVIYVKFDWINLAFHSLFFKLFINFLFISAYAGVSTCFSPKEDKWVFIEYKTKGKKEKNPKGGNSTEETVPSKSEKVEHCTQENSPESSEQENSNSSDSCFEEVNMEANDIKSDEDFEVVSVSKDSVESPDSSDSQFSIADFEPEDTTSDTMDDSPPDGVIDNKIDSSDKSGPLVSESLNDSSSVSLKHKKLERVSKGHTSVDLPQEMCQSVTTSKSMPHVAQYSNVNQNSVTDTDNGIQGEVHSSLNCAGSLSFVPLRAAKQHILHSPLTAFRHLPIVKNPYMSPLLASDDLLKDLPPVYLVVSTYIYIIHVT